MKVNDYQAKALKTAIYPNKGHNLTYPVLKLAGEAGEVAEKLGKAIRDNNGEIDEQRRQDLINELGDCSWYICSIAYELDVDLEEVFQRNLEKLNSRNERGKLQGSGDNR